MARTSRKNTEYKGAMYFRTATDNDTTYNSAIYARLSLEDKKEQGNSIEGQTKLIMDYAKENPEIKICGVYADNGFSGANFNRPQFTEMMDDVEKGEINCIIVKDLSRLGRNYLEVMDYIEQVFPLLNVRFISVNDHVDTFSAKFSKDSLLVALKSLVNEMYLQDITDKINSSFKTMQEKGWYIPAVPPYGYAKAIDDKHKLVVDQEATEVVRQIFDWALQGMTKMGIAKRLEEKGVPSPRNYFYQIGIVTHEKYGKKMYWQSSTIGQILKNRVYIGDMVGGKTKIKKGIAYKQNEEEQIVVEGTHEAIIEKDNFYKVRELLEHSKTKYKSTLNQPVPFDKPPAIFKNVVYCGHCGKKMATNFGKKTHKYSASYVCNHCCTHKAIWVAKSFESLEETVLKTVKAHIVTIAEFQDIIQSINRQTQNCEMVQELRTKIAAHKKEEKKFKSVLVQIYMDLADNMITSEEYSYTKAKYSKLQQDEKNIISMLEMQIEQHTDSLIEKSSLNGIVQKYFNLETLDRETVENIIEKVEIFSSKEIKITFKYGDEFQVYKTLAKKDEGAAAW